MSALPTVAFPSETGELTGLADCEGDVIGLACCTGVLGLFAVPGSHAARPATAETTNDDKIISLLILIFLFGSRCGLSDRAEPNSPVPAERAGFPAAAQPDASCAITAERLALNSTYQTAIIARTATLRRLERAALLYLQIIFEKLWAIFFIDVNLRAACVHVVTAAARAFNIFTFGRIGG